MKKVKQIINPSANKQKKESFFHPQDNIFWIILIAALTFIVYQSVLKFKLVNWDDKRYLQETPMIQGLNWENIQMMFTNKVLKSYNPLVLLSFAIDYEVAKLKPEWCHGVNLLFHILNALLVFACMKKMRFKIEVAGIIALLFALHPLSVEAVAWIAGRKDMIYGFFYLLAWLMYLNYINSNRKYQYVLCILLFTLSLFSKVQAVTFPFILIITDYMLSKTMNWKLVLNKIPFLILSVIFGIVAVSDSTLIADKYSVPPTFIDKITYSIMGFGLYLQKLIIPFAQSAIYSFPVKGSAEYIRLLIAGIAILLLVTFSIIFTIKKAKTIAGGLLFYSISIGVVLHIIAFNSALIYERFTYLASIGLFMAILSLPQLFPVLERQGKKIMIGIVLLFGFLTYNRAFAWKNGRTMWSDVIEKNPRASEAFNNRGMIYFERGEYDLAMSDFKECIKLKPNQPDAYNNMSIVYFNKKEYKEALEKNALVLKIDSSHREGITNRGCFYFNMQQYDSAIYYYSYAGRQTPNNASAFFYAAVANYHLRKYEAAIDNFHTAIRIVPKYADAYAFLAASYARRDMEDSAMYVVTTVESFLPASEARKMVSNIFIEKGSQSYSDHDPVKALSYFELAKKIKPDNAEAYYNIGGVCLSRQDVEGARENWRKTLTLNPDHVQAKEWMQKIGDK